MANQPSTGKYKFNTFADLTVTTEFNSIGIPLKAVLYHFNSGDVIDVQEMYFDDKTNEYTAKVSAIKEQNRSVPFSILTKVADTTPITTNISRTEKTYSGSTEGMVGNFPNPQPADSANPSKKLDNLKRIGIIVIIVLAIIGILKLFKVF